MGHGDSENWLVNGLFHCFFLVTNPQLLTRNRVFPMANLGGCCLVAKIRSQVLSASMVNLRWVVYLILTSLTWYLAGIKTSRTHQLS